MVHSHMCETFFSRNSIIRLSISRVISLQASFEATEGFLNLNLHPILPFYPWEIQKAFFVIPKTQNGLEKDSSLEERGSISRHDCRIQEAHCFDFQIQIYGNLVKRKFEFIQIKLFYENEREIILFF